MNQLPKVLEDIILDYKYQLEHYEKFEAVLLQIERIGYNSNPIDNCMSYRIENGNILKTYHIKFCKICGKYYRTNIVHYRNDTQRHYRYSHYNTYLNEDDMVLTSDYIVSFGGDTLYWTNFYRNRKYNKHISCNCINTLWNINWIGNHQLLL